MLKEICQTSTESKPDYRKETGTVCERFSNMDPDPDPHPSGMKYRGLNYLVCGSSRWEGISNKNTKNKIDFF